MIVSSPNIESKVLSKSVSGSASVAGQAQVPDSSRSRSAVSDRSAVKPGSTLSASIYTIDHQVKYLHLQAETDALLQQLQLLQRTRQA